MKISSGALLQTLQTTLWIFGAFACGSLGNKDNQQQVERRTVPSKIATVSSAPVAPVSPPPTIPVTANPSVTPTPGQTSATNTFATWTYWADTRTLLDTHCANCHANPATGGAPSTFVLNSYEDVGTLKGVFSKLDRIQVRVSDGSMPPNAADLANADRSKLLDWIAAGGAKGATTNTPIPAVAFVNAVMTGESATSNFNVQVNFTDTSSSDTWDLYLTSIAGSSSGGTLLASSLPVSTSNYVWNTSSVSQGTFYFYVVLHTGGGAKAVFSPGSVFVSHPAIVTFINPSSSGVSVNGSINVQVSFQNVDSSATWNLYWTPTGGTTGATAVASVVGIATTQVSWNTSALSAASYGLYAEVSQLGTVTKTAAAGSVSVSHPAPGNTSPTVTLTAPNGAQTLLAGTSTSITYTAADAENDSLKFKIELSSDSGFTWTTLATNQTSMSYSWAVPANQTQGVAYRVRVTADDAKGGITSDMSNSDFGIASSNYTYSNSIFAILSNKCSTCHTTGGNQISIINVSVYSNGSTGAFDLRNRIWARVSNNSMPNAPQTAVSASDKQKLLLWFWAGGPQ